MPKKASKTITVCTSGSFYKQALEIEKDLKRLGFKVKLPYTAKLMSKSGNYDIKSYKTWFTNEKNYPLKARRMREHFRKIESADAILVVNLEKNGQPGYIGANALMEMGLAFYLKKPIYILNSIDEASLSYEEIRGMLPVFLDGDLTKVR